MPHHGRSQSLQRRRTRRGTDGAGATISPLTIDIVDPAAEIGRGIAYGTADPAQTPASQIPDATYATVGGDTRIPYGWVDFCGRRPEECDVEKLAPRDLQLTPVTWALLDRVTKAVNRSIEPITNLDHWGTIVDHWDYPVDGKGDCKIYALEKRRLLMKAGVPRQALLMTIMRDLDGDGHAILAVRTDHGDFVLDNLSDRVRPWDATGYRFLKRQAQDDPNVWVDLGGTKGPGLRVASDQEGR